MNYQIKSVTNLDDYQDIHQESSQVEIPKVDPTILIQTTQNDHMVSDEVLKTKSIKKITPKLEISFQSHFMNEHLAVFQNNFQNYIEFIRKSLSEDSRQKFDSWEWKASQSNKKFDVDSLLSRFKLKKSHRQAMQYLRDLKYEDKLNEFLNIVAMATCEQVAMELIEVSHSVWEAYTTIQRLSPSQFQLMNLARKIPARVYSSLKHLTLDSLSQQTLHFYPKLKQRLLYFLQTYAITVILVIAQYFENPYYSSKEKEELKYKREHLNLSDSISDDDDDSDIYGRPRKISNIFL